uniref:Uncharacterized protein n=1 Tax=Clandestinovirus TaxID=2831644 RepID=A0A8F8KKT2_9VIRU|nr:hypothetical protein KOM_12_224 [Clandestinovirus]
MDSFIPIFESSILSEDVLLFMDQVESGELQFSLGKRKRGHDECTDTDQPLAKVQKTGNEDSLPTDEASLDYSLSEDILYESEEHTPINTGKRECQTLDDAASQFNFAPISITSCVSRHSTQLKFVNLSPYFRMTQKDAASKIGTSPQKLSSAWRSIPNRPTEQWPYQTVTKIEYQTKHIIQQTAYQAKEMETKINTWKPLLSSVDASIATEAKRRIEEIHFHYRVEIARLSVEYRNLQDCKKAFDQSFVVQLECKIVS